MALSKNLELSCGLLVNDAYIKVHMVRGTKALCDIHVKTFISKDASDTEKDHVAEKFYSFIPSVTGAAPNFIQQSYEYLKTLPEFEGAIDC